MKDFLEFIKSISENNLYSKLFLGLILLLIIYSVLSAFLYRWKYIITNVIIMIIAAASAMATILVLKKQIESSEDYKSLTELAGYIGIYISIAVYALISIPMFIIWSLVAIFRKKKRKGFIKRIICSGSNFAISVPLIVSTSAAFNVEKKQDNFFSNFCVKIMTFFTGKNPSVITSSLYKITNKLSSLSKDLNNLLEEKWKDLDQQTKNKLFEICKEFASILNDPNVRKTIINFMKKSDEFDQSIKEFSDEFEKAENKMRLDPSYSTANKEQKIEYITNKVTEELKKQFSNKETQTALILMSKIFSTWNKDVVNDFAQLIGDKIDENLSKDSIDKKEDFSAHIIINVLDNIKDDVKALENNKGSENV